MVEKHWERHPDNKLCLLHMSTWMNTPTHTNTHTTCTQKYISHVCVYTHTHTKKHKINASLSASSILQLYIIVPTYIYYFRFYVSIYFICVRVCLHAHMCITCIPGAFRDHKREMIPIELELWMSLNCNMGPGNGTQVHCKSNKYSYPVLYLYFKQWY